MRSGELAALDCKNVLLEERKLLIVDAVTYESNQPIKQDKTKTEAGMRIVPICDLLYRILKPLVENRKPDEPVFTTASGRRITKTGFRSAIKTMNNILTRLANGKGPSVNDVKEHIVTPRPLRTNATKQEIMRHNKAVENYHRKLTEREHEKANQKIVSIRMHDFRDTFATALYDSGLMARDIKMAQYLLGHRDIKTTMDLYVHLSEKRKEKSASEMVTFLDGWMNEMGADFFK